MGYEYEYPPPKWLEGLWRLLRVTEPFENPHTDVGQERRVDTTRVGASVPVEWPTEMRHELVDTKPPKQKPHKHSVGGGHPVQAADPARTKKIRVRNRWGGTLVVDNVDTGREMPKDYSVQVPRPIREREDGWAWQGYPNEGASGDRHLYLVEADGTTHEMIGFYPQTWTCEHYAKYAPDGTILHRIDPGGSIVKANLQWTRFALNRGDEPHRMGLVFPELGDAVDYSVPDGILRLNPGDHKSDGTRTDFVAPRYGQWYRLSRDAYDRLVVGADLEQFNFLVGAHECGFVPVDRGGHGWDPEVVMISGAQWVGSTIGDLEIHLSDLERVTAAA